MAPEYKLTYFDLAGLGEPIRFLLSYGGMDFTDVRISRDQWLNLKPSIPFGQVPILEHNGKASNQSTSICRYLARKLNLAGSNEWEALEIDATVDTIVDFRSKIQKYHYERNESVKESLKGPLFNEVLPFYLPKFDAQVKKNGGYFVGGKLSWADIFFVASVKYIDDMLGKDTVADYQNLKSLKEKVLDLPSIKSFLKKTASK